MRKATSTNLLNQTAARQACGLNYATELIGPRWKAQALLQLTEGCDRFSLMKKQLPGISDQVLGRTLRELEQQELLTRHVISEKPLHVAYHLTARGLALQPILRQLCSWGIAHQPA